MSRVSAALSYLRSVCPDRGNRVNLFISRHRRSCGSSDVLSYGPYGTLAKSAKYMRVMRRIAIGDAAAVVLHITVPRVLENDRSHCSCYALYVAPFLLHPALTYISVPVLRP